MIVEIRSFQRAKDFQTPTFGVNIIRSNMRNGNQAEDFCGEQRVNYASGNLNNVKVTRSSPSRQGSGKRTNVKNANRNDRGGGNKNKQKSVGKVQKDCLKIRILLYKKI